MERRLNLSGTKIYGRDKELGTIRRAVERATSGSQEIILLEGPSGVGKSSLAKKLFAQNHKTCLFGSGKFAASSDAPFAAIISPFDEIIIVVCQDERLRATIVSCIKQELTANDRSNLVQFIPSFHMLMDDDDDESLGGLSSSMEDAILLDRKDLSTKIKFSLRGFLRVLSNHSRRVVVLFFLDLQFADTASMDVLDFIANDDDQIHFMVLATYCSRDVSADHRVSTWKAKASNITAETTTTLTIIALEYLMVDQINTFLADVTNLDESATLPLARLLMTRTNGNWFFMTQILEHLQNEHMMYYDLSTFQWKWDIDRVHGMALSENVVEFVVFCIKKHPPGVQWILQVGACLGYKFDPKLLETAKAVLPGEPIDDVEKNLELCFNASLLERLSDGRVIFLHEKIHHAALELLPQGEDLEKLHLRIGLLLWEQIKSQRQSDPHILFLCADQLSEGSNHVDQVSTKLQLAELYDMVGRKAIKLSAFGTAATYFTLGIKHLDDIGNMWRDYKLLCTSLFVNLAEVEFNVGKLDASMEAVEEVLANRPSKSATMRATLTRLRILKAESKLKEFVAASLKFLEELGMRLPAAPSVGRSRLVFRGVMKKFKMLTDTAILDLPIQKDQSKFIVMHVLSQMMVPLEMLEMHDLCLMASCYAVTYSLKHGISELSPEAFVLVGGFMISIVGSLVEGYRMGELALKLSNKLDSTRIDARVANLVYVLTKPWQMVPLSQCVDPMVSAYEAAMKMGDPFNAYMAVTKYAILRYLSSLALRPLVRDLEQFSNQMLEYGQKVPFFAILPLLQCVLVLSGTTDDPIDMSRGRAIDRQYELGNENGIGQQACWSFTMQLAFYMHNDELASEMSSKLQTLKLGFMKAHVLYQVRVFFFGLIAIKNARLTRKRRYRVEASRHIATMRHWVSQRAANLVHKLLILVAYKASLTGKSGLLLQSLYDDAIAASRKSGFVQDAALASELAGDCLATFEDSKNYAESYYVNAHRMWLSWGAIAVANKLSERLETMYPDIILEDEINLDSHRSSFLSRDRFNLNASETHFQRLSERLMGDSEGRQL